MDVSDVATGNVSTLVDWSDTGILLQINPS